MSKRALVAVVAAAAAATMAAAGLAPAADATTYRYWVYWHHTGGSWHYSGVGASGYRVPDGGVEGWRFGRGESSSSAATPRLAGEYDTLCPEAPATADGTQVAVVIDYGTETDAPDYPYRPAHCITLTGDHQGSDALAKAAGSLRVENGLVCAIRGYPKAPECGKTVDDPKPSPKPSTPRPVSTSSSPAPRQAPPTAQVSAVATRRAQGSTAEPRPAPSTAAPSRKAMSAVAGADPAPSDSDLGDSARSESDPATPTGLPLGLIGGGLLVIGLGAAAAVKARR